jgi:hypothetical protein
MSEKERHESYHDKGQKDGSEGKYEPPHGIIDDLTTWSSEGMERNRDDNEAYNVGYHNAKDQRD